MIANVPTPAGLSILRGGYREGTVDAGWLFLSALGPTLVAIVVLRCL